MIKDIMKRFDKKFGYKFNIGVVPDDQTKEELKRFIADVYTESYLAGRTCKQNEIDYHVQEAIKDSKN